MGGSVYGVSGGVVDKVLVWCMHSSTDMLLGSVVSGGLGRLHVSSFVFSVLVLYITSCRIFGMT